MKILTIAETEWKRDRTIPDSVWNRYMKRFEKKYRLKKDELNIWNLRCKFGTVQLYSLSKRQLCFVGDFRSRQHLTWFKKSLKKLTVKTMILQESDTDIVVMFGEDKLDLMSNTLRIYRKYKISDEHRKALAKRMIKIREMKQ